MGGSGGVFGLGIEEYPDIFGGAVGRELFAADFFPPGVAQLTARDVRAMASGGGMSFIGDLIGGIGDAAKTVVVAAGEAVQALPTIAEAIAVGRMGIEAIQGAVQGRPVAISTTTGSPMPMPMAMAPADAQAQFVAACNADPTGQCQAAIRAALAGGRMNGNGGMSINPTTGSPMLAAGVTEAGALSALRGLASSPGGAAALRALGFGALVAGGEALVEGAASGVGALFGGGGQMVRGPLLMAWPAQTPYPRGIVLRAPDKPEKRFRTVGAPLLSSGDVAAVRRVQRAAGRARKGRGRRATGRQPNVVYLPGAAATHHVCGGCMTSPCACK